MDGWTEIFTTSSSALANMKKHLLEDANIKVVLLNQKDSLYNNFGEIKIYVRPDDAIEAIRIIKDDE